MSAMRHSLLEVWNVDIAQALRICEGKQVKVCESEISYVVE